MPITFAFILNIQLVAVSLNKLNPLVPDDFIKPIFIFVLELAL